MVCVNQWNIEFGRSNPLPGLATINCKSMP